MRNIIAGLAAVAGFAAFSAPAQASVPCGSAANYDMFVSANEAHYIATYYGVTLQGNPYWDSCVDQPSQNRTYVKWHYPGTGGRVMNMEAYLYDRFDSSNGCNPVTHRPDLGNVSFALRNSNGTLVNPASIGTYATPCE